MSVAGNPHDYTENGQHLCQVFRSDRAVECMQDSSQACGYVATGTSPHSTTHFSPHPSSPGHSIKLSNLPSLNNRSNSSRLYPPYWLSSKSIQYHTPHFRSKT